MEVLDKWKVFAVEQVFSHEPTNEEAVLLYDGLCACDSDKQSVVLLNSLKAIPWHIFETKPLQWIVDQMTCLAEVAQSTSESFLVKPDLYVVVKDGCIQYVSSTDQTINVKVIDEDVFPYEHSENDAAIAESLVRVW